jgi:hypothetical protein
MAIAWGCQIVEKKRHFMAQARCGKPENVLEKDVKPSKNSLRVPLGTGLCQNRFDHPDYLNG